MERSGGRGQMLNGGGGDDAREGGWSPTAMQLRGGRTPTPQGPPPRKFHAAPLPQCASLGHMALEIVAAACEGNRLPFRPGSCA